MRTIFTTLYRLRRVEKNSCMYAVFVLNEIMAYVRHKDSKAYAVYLDFFDKVNRTKLLFKLMYNINREIWLLIKNFDANLLLFVQDNKGQISGPFSSTVGVGRR
jgi:hypothetical protein